MNRVSVLNLVQGILSLWLAYIYFTTGNRLAVTTILFTLFLISLVLISLGVKRRSKFTEIVEICIYVVFFGLSFLGIEDIRSIPLAGPIPKYFWLSWASGLIFNWGEWIANLVLKITSSSE